MHDFTTLSTCYAHDEAHDVIILQRIVYSPFTAFSNLSRQTPASCVNICRACWLRASSCSVLYVARPMVTPRKRHCRKLIANYSLQHSAACVALQSQQIAASTRTLSSLSDRLRWSQYTHEWSLEPFLSSWPSTHHAVACYGSRPTS
jgi:hypothetical protein